MDIDNKINQKIEEYEKTDKSIDKALVLFNDFKDNTDPKNLNKTIKIKSYDSELLSYKLERIFNTIKLKNDINSLSDDLKKKCFKSNDKFFILNEENPKILPFEGCILFKILNMTISDDKYNNSIYENLNFENEDKEKVENLYNKLNNFKSLPQDVNNLDYLEYFIENTNNLRKDKNSNNDITKVYCIGKVEKNTDDVLKLKYYKVSYVDIKTVKINFVDINT